MYLGYKTAYATLTPGMAWAGIYWPITPGSESHVSLIKSLLFPLLSGEMGKLRQNLLLRKTYMVQYFFQMQLCACLATRYTNALINQLPLSSLKESIS